jgi:aspartyl-tRNA(Asn)/glutamyl-tRNA(Gln) amidotransferase subunit B
MFEKGEYTARNAELIIRHMVSGKIPPEDAASRHNIPKAIGKAGAKEGGKIEAAVKSVLEENPKAVQDYKSGEEKALHFLVGLCMKETRGAVDAKEVRKLIQKMAGK